MKIKIINKIVKIIINQLTFFMMAVPPFFNLGHSTVDLKLILSIPSVFLSFAYISLIQIISYTAPTILKWLKRK